MAKIKGMDLEILTNTVQSFDTEAMREIYRARDFPRSAAVKDLNKRYRWDLFYLACRVGLRQKLEGDYFDDHIYTALKSAIPDL